MKRLIVNADDLGYDPEIDRGILEAHRAGIVTSTTAMVDAPFAAAALRSAPRTLGVGLHVVLPPGRSREEAEAAVRRQLARFEELRGAPPTHLDSHKHVHAEAAALDAFVAVARERALPVRAIDARMRGTLACAGIVAPDGFLGDAARRPAWTAEALRAAVSAVPAGVTELMAHPGHRPSHARTSFGVEREIELAALCDPGVTEAVSAAGVRLCSFADAWPPAPRGRGGRCGGTMNI